MTYTTDVTRFRTGLSLPLAYQAVPKLYKSVTVARLVVPNLAVGDLVCVHGTGQVELGPSGPTRAMHARYLKATKTGNNASTEGLLLDRPMGHNFTDLQHYSMQSASGSFVATAAWSGTVEVMLVMYAAALSGIATDPRSLSVKYVELRADVHKSDTGAVTVAVNGDVVFPTP